MRSGYKFKKINLRNDEGLKMLLKCSTQPFGDPSRAAGRAERNQRTATTGCGRNPVAISNALKRCATPPRRPASGAHSRPAESATPRLWNCSRWSRAIVQGRGACISRRRPNSTPRPARGAIAIGATIRPVQPADLPAAAEEHLGPVPPGIVAERCAHETRLCDPLKSKPRRSTRQWLVSTAKRPPSLRAVSAPRQIASVCLCRTTPLL